MRLISLFAFASAFVPAVAHSAVFTIDDFSVIQGTVTDFTGGGATISGPIDLASGTRTISVEAFTNSNRRAQSGADFLVDDDDAALNLFAIDNGPVSRSVVALSYFLNPIGGFDGGGATFLVLNFLANDPGFGNTTSLHISIPNANLGSFAIPAIPPASNLVSIALSSPQTAALVAGGPFILTFDGSNAYDVALDTITLTTENPETQVPQVPEPASIMVMAAGMVLTGLGLRRRKA